MVKNAALDISAVCIRVPLQMLGGVNWVRNSFSTLCNCKLNAGFLRAPVLEKFSTIKRVNGCAPRRG